MITRHYFFSATHKPDDGPLVHDSGVVSISSAKPEPMKAMDLVVTEQAMRWGCEEDEVDVIQFNRV